MNTEKMTAADSERFQSGADKYASYLETPEGRLRLDLAFANLLEFLPGGMQRLCVLDLGGGTGVTAVRLAQLGAEVTLLDSSMPMLELATRNASQAGVMDRVALKHGDAAQVGDLFPSRSFDVILCHNVLEHVDDPGAVVRGAARALRDSSAILSILVRQQAGEVLKAAIQAGDLAAANTALAAEWGHESLYGGSVRLFNSKSLRAMLTPALLAVIAERGIRVVSDYLPPQISRSADYERIFALERDLGARTEFAAIARYTQCLTHLAGTPTEIRP